MNSCIFILNAPALSFSKADLYSTDFSFGEIGSFIKAISDAFFLSNDFRKNNQVYFCTQYNSDPFIIGFNGSKIKYLGPSFFSAAHLLLRAKNHIKNPHSKSGKLTPGLSVYNFSYEWILEKFTSEKLIRIIQDRNPSKITTLKSDLSSHIFLYGFYKLPKKYSHKEISLGPLTIDEQIIITNYFIDQVM